MVQESLYEQLFPLTTVMRQRMVDNFAGDVINERWATEDTGGSPTYLIVDAVDEGLAIAVGQFAAEINFGDIARQYDFDSSVIIGVAKRSTANTLIRSGLRDGAAVITSAGNDDCAYFQDSTTNTFKSLVHNDGVGGGTVTASDIAIDTIFHKYQITLTASDIVLKINDVVKVTVTTDLPNQGMQPFCSIQDITTGVKNVRIRYMEAYNT